MCGEIVILDTKELTLSCNCGSTKVKDPNLIIYNFEGVLRV